MNVRLFKQKKCEKAKLRKIRQANNWQNMTDEQI